MPELRANAPTRSLAAMDFGFFYDPAVGRCAAVLDRKPPATPTGAPVTATTTRTLNTEPRIASYIGIAAGQVPPEHYFHLDRTFPRDCDVALQETQPGGETRSYLGVDVFEGALRPTRHADRRRAGAASMFEALMVPLFVPEEHWGPR